MQPSVRYRTDWWLPEPRSGLNVTIVMGCQLRILPEQVSTGSLQWCLTTHRLV